MQKYYNEVKEFLSRPKIMSFWIYKIIPKSDLDNELIEYFKGTKLEQVELTNKTLLEFLYAYINGIGLCPICGEKTFFHGRNQGYRKYCSKCGASQGAKHAGKNRKEIANIHEVIGICEECGKEFTYLLRPNNHTIKPRKFCSLTCKSIYTHKHFSEEDKERINAKRKATCLEKYGNEYVVNSKYTREKTKEKLGVEYAQHLPNYGDICKESYKQHHNGKEFKHSKESIEKIKSTKIEKYGSLLAPIYNKKYIMPSGKEVYVQGFEGWALDILFNELHYTEEDIIVERKNIKNEIGSIYYTDSLGQHIYYPDIYIKSENTVIEVKSPYTISLHKEINKLKKESTLAKGINFKYMVLDVYHEKLKSWEFR